MERVDIDRGSPAAPSAIADGIAAELFGRMQFELDLGDDGPEAARRARDAYEQAVGSPSSHVEWHAYLRFCRGIGLAGEDTAFLRENLASWTASMGGPSVREVLGILPGIGVARAAALVRRTREEGGYVRRHAPVPFRDVERLGREDMRLLVEPGLRALPGTWFCPVSGDGCRAIPGAVIARLAGVRAGLLRTAAVIEILLFAEEYPDADLSYVVAAFERWSDAFSEAGLDPEVAADVLVVKQHFLIYESLLLHQAPAPRLAAEIVWRGADARLAHYRATQRDDGDLHAALSAAALTPLPNGKPSTRLAAEFTQKRKDFGLVCEANRKVDADDLSDAFADRLATAQIRSRGVMRAWRESAAAEAVLRSDRSQGRLDYCWDEDVVSREGKLLAHRQRVRMQAVFADELEEELDHGVVQSRFTFVEEIETELDAVLPSDADETQREEMRLRNAGRRVAFRFVEVEALGPVKVEPWWVEVFRWGVLLAPSQLDVDLLDGRRDAIVAWRLPRVDCRPAGLVGPDGRAEGRLCARGLNAGLVIVPIASFAHGMAIGATALRTMAMTYARVGELLQITHGTDLWRKEDVVDAGGGRVKRPAWLAFVKGGDVREPFVVHDTRTMPLLAALVRLRFVREDIAGGSLPDAVPCQALARKVGPAPYVFALRGRMLSGGDLNFMHRYLFAGIQRLRNHDVRHSAANRAGQERASPGEIAFRLKHLGAERALPHRTSANLRNAAMYARETARQSARSRAAYADARVQFEVLMGARPEGSHL